MSVPDTPDYFCHLRSLFEVSPPVGLAKVLKSVVESAKTQKPEVGLAKRHKPEVELEKGLKPEPPIEILTKPLLAKVSTKTLAMSQAREQVFLDHVKALLVGIELGQMARTYANPAIRLEYLRYLSGLDGASWVKPAGLDKTSAALWRTSETLLQAAAIGTAEGWEKRRQILAILRPWIAQGGASLPWVLWGPHLPPNLRMMQMRVEWAVSTVWGNPQTKDADPDGILEARGFPAARKMDSPTAPNASQFLKTIAKDSGGVVPATWITDGEQSPPRSLAEVVADLRTTDTADDVDLERLVDVTVSGQDVLRLWSLVLRAHRDHPEEGLDSMILPLWHALNRGGISRLLRDPGALTPDGLVEILKPLIPKRMAKAENNFAMSQLELELRRAGLLTAEAAPSPKTAKKQGKKKR